jgi:ribonucleotide reductase alpha subunit
MRNYYVLKRNGRKEPLDVSKIRKYTKAACEGLEGADYMELELDAKIQFRDGITTAEIQETLIKTAVDKIDVDKPNWNFVAARLFLYDLYHRVTGFTGYNHLREYFEKGEKAGRILSGLKEKYDLDDLNGYIKPERDLQFTYIGIKTLYDRYIIKDKNKNPIELPQQLFMGIAMFLAQNENNPESIPEEYKEKIDLNNPKSIRGYWAKKFYDVISKFEVMVATPTLSNARTTRHQLSSCFVGSMNDNIEGIFDDFKEMAILSKFGGGIGWDVSKIRALGSFIDNYRNAAGGVVPWLKITNDIAIAVDQLGCVAKNSYVKVLKSVRTQNFVHDFRNGYKRYDLSEYELVEAVASFASSFSFEYGKFSKNFISSLLFDYVVNTKGDKFLEKVYGLTHDQYKEIINRYKKMKKGLPEGFETIKDYPDYAISKEGIVIDIHTLRPLSKNIDKKGYVRVTLGEKGVALHLLLAKQFLNYKKGMTVDHIDGDKLNNKLNNLQLISNKKNVSKNWRKNHLKRTEEARIRRYLLNGKKLNGDRINTDKIEIKEIQTEIIPIYKLRIGDLIASYNVNKNRVEYKPVIAKHKIEVKKENQIKIAFDDGNYIITSVWHPMPKFVNNKLVYVRSDSLKIGDYSVNEKNEKVKIVSILQPDENEEFFDLTVRDNNNYFCSTHNKDGSFHLIHNTRKGAIAVYLEPWHMDIYDFLDLKKNSGEERRRAHDLFPALWIPDLFMKRVEEDGMWTLFDPYEVKDLTDLYGEEFEKRYIKYENDPNITKETIKAKELWKKILLEYYETGSPFLCFKDNANKRNQNNHNGIIRSSNLCVTADTKLLTKEYGEIEIGNLVEVKKLRKVTCWNGKEWSETEIFRTDGGKGQKVISVYVEIRDTLKAEVLRTVKIKATPYHKWYVVDYSGNVIEKRTVDLREGMYLEKTGFNDVNLSYKTVRIEDEGEIAPTYCGTEPKRHKLVFNGVLTGNCTEIYQNTEPNHYKVKVTFCDGSFKYFEEEEDVAVENGNINLIKKAKKITSIDKIDGKQVYIVEKIAVEGKTAVCNLASINLSKVNTPEKIKEVVPIAIRMLDNVIDLNFYPVKKAKDTNVKNRAIGLGAMGEAQLIAERQLSWGSEEHLKLIDEIFERISYHAIETSCELAKEKGVYPEFNGSKWSRGVLPIDTANEESKKILERPFVCDWDTLREKVRKGIRNGYLMAIAPTSSISILAGTTQTIEPVYKRKWYEENLSGLIPVVVPNLSVDTYMFYTPAYELDQRVLVKAAAIRQKWVDQGQSLNIFITTDKASGRYLNEIYMLGWKLGLKSFYYLRSQSPEVKEEVIDRSIECYGCQ